MSILKKSLSLILPVMVMAIFLTMPTLVLAGSPLISLETYNDWYYAPIEPVLSDYAAAIEVYRNTYEIDYDYRTTDLNAYAGNPGYNPPLGSPGLVMAWGSDGGSENPQLASWKYVYPQDPNLIGTILSITVTPPVGIWAVSLTLNDQFAGWNTWDWYVASPGNPLPINPGAVPIAPGVATTITLDPNIAANQSGSNVFIPFGFNPAIAISIQADELSAGGFLLFPPNPITNTPRAWNYWSNLNVAPEPVSSLLFVTGGAVLAGKRYLKKRKKT